MSANQTLSEKELLRKKEMQDRAFLQWVTKKNEEEKAKREAIQQKEMLKLEQRRQRILMGKAAYSQWIKSQDEKDKLLLKQRQREHEQAQLDHQLQLEHQKKVQEAFETWKMQKDLEWQLTQQQPITNLAESKRYTPTVPGYCSVWICDDELRKRICTIVPRQPT